MIATILLHVRVASLLFELKLFRDVCHLVLVRYDTHTSLLLYHAGMKEKTRGWLENSGLLESLFHFRKIFRTALLSQMSLEGCILRR